MTNVEIKFACSEQAGAFAGWAELSEGLESHGIMIGQESLKSRTIVAVFHSRRRASSFVSWFAFEGGLEKFKEYLLENEISRELTVDRVEFIDTNKDGMRIGIR